MDPKMWTRENTCLVSGRLGTWILSDNKLLAEKTHLKDLHFEVRVSCDLQLKLNCVSLTYYKDAKQGSYDNASQYITPVMHVVWHPGQGSEPCSHHYQKLQEVLQ